MTATLDAAPCVINDMPESEYHASPAFSSSGAKAILKSPAHFAWQRDNGRPDKKEFDLGSAVHSAILGTGYPIRVLDFDSWRTKDAKSAAEDARAEGAVPMLAHEYRPVAHITAAVLAHPTARALLEQPGVAEASAFATDPTTGVQLRARFDLLPAPTEHRTTIVELKSARSADPSRFQNAVAEFGYDLSQEFYKFVLTLARGDFDPAMKFVVVETSAPYLVSVIELDAEFEAIGKQRMRRAIDTYAACMASGKFPGYGDETHLISAPRWLSYEEGFAL